MNRTVRLGAKHLLLFAVAAIVFILILRLSSTLLNKSPSANSPEEIAAFLKEYGWEIELEPYTTKLVEIPKEFNPVYTIYNDLQRKQGFDLLPYRATTAESYCFKVTNFDGRDDVYANILVHKNKIIGGDICSYAMDGFMTGFDGSTSY